MFIFCNKTVCCVDNCLSTAIILLQTENMSLRVVFIELQNVLDSCSAKGIDALTVITYHANIPMNHSEPFQNNILGIVCVLIFINQYIFELRTNFFQGIREVSK